jgi:hypothetical protein
VPGHLGLALRARLFVGGDDLVAQALHDVRPGLFERARVRAGALIIPQDARAVVSGR